MSKVQSLMKHFKSWGAVYILLLLFLGSWLGQFISMQSEINEKGIAEFWSATFENWQSEWLQLVAQAVLLLGMKHLIFKADSKDQERLEAKIDTLVEICKQKN